MSELSKPILNNNTIVIKEDEETNDKFSLNKLSENLSLSAERSKCIHDLYEKNNVLKSKSSNLIKELDKEKNINHLQSEFVSLVSHEFKTPLAIIKASADVLNRVKSAGNMDLLDKQLEKITKAVVRMSKLIESTLNLSRLESGKLQFKPKEFCIEDLLLEVVERHQDINPQANFNIRIGQERRRYIGDPDLIDQVFTNLTTNALKYSKEHPDITISCTTSNNRYLISFKDHGIGMSKQDLSKLFSKFFRAKNTAGIVGTGIGLYLVKQFIELHRGDIQVKSEENVGTEFIIILPINNEVKNG